jgi:hypothetical protein
LRFLISIDSIVLKLPSRRKRIDGIVHCYFRGDISSLVKDGHSYPGHSARQNTRCRIFSPSPGWPY